MTEFNLRNYLITRAEELELVNTGQQNAAGELIYLSKDGNDIILAETVMARLDWPIERIPGLHTRRAILNTLGGMAGAVFLNKLKAFSELSDQQQINSIQDGMNTLIQAGFLPAGTAVAGLQLAVSESLFLLDPNNGGVDFSEQETINVLNLLKTLEIVTQSEVDAILQMQQRKIKITHVQIAKALGRNEFV